LIHSKQLPQALWQGAKPLCVSGAAAGAAFSVHNSIRWWLALSRAARAALSLPCSPASMLVSAASHLPKQDYSEKCEHGVNLMIK
jgi:hypothetical protein